jgi:ferredoxin
MKNEKLEKGEKMKPIVKEGCCGCELCVQTCPEVFNMENNVAITKVDKVPCDIKDACIQAMEECPVGCIVLEGYIEERTQEM